MRTVAWIATFDRWNARGTVTIFASVNLPNRHSASCGLRFVPLCQHYRAMCSASSCLHAFPSTGFTFFRATILLLISLHLERAWKFASRGEASFLHLIATQSHGNKSCWLEGRVPWVCVAKDKHTRGPHSHASIHGVRSEVKSTVVRKLQTSAVRCCRARTRTILVRQPLNP